MGTLDDVLLGVMIIASLIFVPWVFLIRPWLRRRGLAADPNSNTPTRAAPEVVNLAERHNRWSIRGELARLFLIEERADVMPSDRATSAWYEPGASQVRHHGETPVSVSAAPNTADTGLVPGATGASTLDTSARDIIRASAIAELLDSGLLTNRDKAICQIFHCSKAASTRPDAPFQVALRLVEQHRGKRQPEYRPLDADRRPAELSKAEQH